MKLKFIDQEITSEQHEYLLAVSVLFQNMIQDTGDDLKGLEIDLNYPAKVWYHLEKYQKFGFWSFEKEDDLQQLIDFLDFLNCPDLLESLAVWIAEEINRMDPTVIRTELETFMKDHKLRRPEKSEKLDLETIIMKNLIQ